MSQVVTADGKTVIHFHTFANGVGCVACNPGERDLGTTRSHANYQMSGDPRAVNCTQCRTTEAYRVEEQRLRALLKGAY